MNDCQDLVTERLRLRQWRRSDLPWLPAILSDPVVMAFSEAGTLDPAQREVWLDRRLALPPNGGAVGHRAIALGSDDTILGYVSLSRTTDRTAEDEVELGIRLVRRAWGRGYAREAAAAMIAKQFENQKTGRVIGIVDPGNGRSVNLLKRLGMIYERPISFPGYDHPDHLYAVARTG